MRNLRFLRLASAFWLAGVLLPQGVRACTACAGRSDEAMAQGMNMGIFALLVVITCVLAGFAAFAVFLARRAAQFPLPSAPAEGATSAGADAEPETEAHLAESISQPTK